MADEDVKRALMEALGGSTRPRMRPKGMGESGRAISNADKLKMMMRESEGVGEADTKISPEQMKLLELMMLQQQGVRDKAERKAFPPPSMMKKGGEVKRKKKPKMGAVMKGRGGSYKGMK